MEGAALYDGTTELDLDKLATASAAGLKDGASDIEGVDLAAIAKAAAAGAEVRRDPSPSAQDTSQALSRRRLDSILQDA